MMEFAAERGPYYVFVVLMVVGVYLLLTHRSLLKNFVGLYLMQLGIVVFFVSIAVRVGGSIPVMLGEGHDVAVHNPVPHALMVTAIVVSVATLGVAIAILLRIQKQQGSLDEHVEDVDGPEGGS